jgi:hypothetical protein
MHIARYCQQIERTCCTHVISEHTATRYHALLLLLLITQYVVDHRLDEHIAATQLAVLSRPFTRSPYPRWTHCLAPLALHSLTHRQSDTAVLAAAAQPSQPLLEPLGERPGGGGVWALYANNSAAASSSDGTGSSGSSSGSAVYGHRAAVNAVDAAAALGVLRRLPQPPAVETVSLRGTLLYLL